MEERTINYDFVNFPNLGYIVADFSDEELEPIRNEVDKIYLSNFDDKRNIPFNNNLAGHIINEYLLRDSHNHIEELVKPYCQAYENEFNYIKTVNPVMFGQKFGIRLTSSWVNFQKPTEYNPLHEHGGLFSFVMYLNVPYSIEEERQRYSKMSEGANQAASFNFGFTTSIGKIATYSIPVDNTFRNKMILFPANMQHYVNPFFTSDEYRISVSGNFSLDWDTLSNMPVG